MLRKNLLSIAALALTIIINLVITVVLLNRLRSLSQDQWAEQPFHDAVSALADHSGKLQTQIHAAFAAHNPEDLAEVEKRAKDESEAAAAAIRTLSQDHSSIIGRTLPWNDPTDKIDDPVSVTARLLVERVETSRAEMVAIVDRAIKLSHHAIEGEKLLDEAKTTLAKVTRETLPLQAAKIDDSVNKSRHGAEVCTKVAERLRDIATKSRPVDELIGEIATASGEQTQGIDQVNKAVNQTDKMVQASAARAEEGAGVSHELTTQSASLHTCVEELERVVGGRETQPGQAGTTSPQKSPGKSKRSRQPAHVA